MVVNATPNFLVLILACCLHSRKDSQEWCCNAQGTRISAGFSHFLFDILTWYVINSMQLQMLGARKFSYMHVAIFIHLSNQIVIWRISGWPRRQSLVFPRFLSLLHGVTFVDWESRSSLQNLSTIKFALNLALLTTRAIACIKVFVSGCTSFQAQAQSATEFKR